MRYSSITIVFLLSLILLSCKGQTDNQNTGEEMNIAITSSVFNEGEFIPKKYSCDDVDISPPLEWGGIPEGTKELALICDDPDAPKSQCRASRLPVPQSILHPRWSIHDE